MNDKHRFLQFEHSKDNDKNVRMVAQAIMETYIQMKLPRKKWLRDPKRVISCYSGSKRWNSKPLDIKLVENYLSKYRTFDHTFFDLFEPQCSWLDPEIPVARDFHILPGHNEAMILVLNLHSLGETYPISPAIDREGKAIGSMQLPLQKQILRLQRKLVKTSHLFTSDLWLNALREFISACISVIDITLHQIYTQAKYKPMQGWNFDLEALGASTGRRFNDKLKWIFKITGNQLMMTDRQRENLNLIRRIRNHIQHFDPPCFAFTLEEVANWLNVISDIGCILWEIRRCCGASITIPIIEMIIGPKVKFVPPDPMVLRIPQTSASGYASSVSLAIETMNQ